MDAVQPKHLTVSGLLRQVAGTEGGGVVAAGFGHAHAALHGTDILLLHEDFDRVQPLGVIGPHRAHHHDVLYVLGGVDP